jgi:hypothetical protein
VDVKNPLDRDVIGRNVTVVATGYVAHRNGKSLLEAANIGFSWGWFYKNFTMSFVLLFVTVAYAWGNKHEYQSLFVVAQVILNMSVFAIVYCKHIVKSDFKQRWLFRVCWPLARHFPYTSTIWLYLALFLPVWGLMWYQCSVTPGQVHW